jgi:hypothetical protein
VGSLFANGLHVVSLARDFDELEMVIGKLNDDQNIEKGNESELIPFS